MRKLMLAVLTVALSAAIAHADAIAVGAGDNHALIAINFGDGAVYEFDVAFSAASIGGLEAFDIIEAHSSLTTVREDFGWGVFVDGIAYQGHSNAGYDGGENWWHYWVKEPGETSWTSPMYGVAARTILPGGADGWVYGSASAPVMPEPATLSLLGIGAAALLRRRR